MAKDSYFFSHDYGSRNDPKMQKLLMRLGQSGKGVYWDLIEISYEQGGHLKLSDIENYAFALRTDCDCIQRLINEFDLFKKNDDFFWSESVLKRLERRIEISKKASENAQKRWGNAEALNNNANALQSHEKTMLRKETKGEEKKKKEIIENSPTRDECISFFNEKKLPEIEAQKFFTKYQALGWQLSGKKIFDWKSLAESWILKIPEFTNNIKNDKNDTKRTIQPTNKGFGKI